jgi:hypothetical protein
VPAELSQTRAEVTCRNLRAEILTVEENMDLKKLMIEHEIESLWTSIYRSITTQTLVDESEYRPAVKTQFDEIDSQKLLASNLDNSKGVILRLKDGKLLYEIVPNTELHKTLCLSKIHFPGMTKDLKSLTNIQKNMVVQLDILSDRVKQSFSNIEKEVANLPRSADNFTGMVISELAIQGKIEEKINGLSEYSSRMKDIFGNISSPLDILELFSENEKFVDTVRYVEKFAKDVLTEPFLLVEKNYLNEIGPESVATLQLKGAEANRLLVTLESKEERVRMPVPKEINGNIPKEGSGFINSEFPKIEISRLFLILLNPLIQSSIEVLYWEIDSRYIEEVVNCYLYFSNYLYQNSISEAEVITAPEFEYVDYLKNPDGSTWREFVLKT